MAELKLKRKIYDELLKWKNGYAPEYALFIKGARRVGKTTISEELGRKEYKSYITIDFQAANDTIRDLFVNSLLDLDSPITILMIKWSYCLTYNLRPRSAICFSWSLPTYITTLTLTAISLSSTIK